MVKTGRSLCLKSAAANKKSILRMQEQSTIEIGMEGKDSFKVDERISFDVCQEAKLFCGKLEGKSLSKEKSAKYWA